MPEQKKCGSRKVGGSPHILGLFKKVRVIDGTTFWGLFQLFTATFSLRHKNGEGRPFLARTRIEWYLDPIKNCKLESGNEYFLNQNDFDLLATNKAARTVQAQYG